MQSARGFEYGVRHIISPQSGSVFDVLLSTLNFDRMQSEFLLNLGSIYLNHQRLKENSSVSVGDYLRVHTKPRRFLCDDGRWNERVLFHNEHFVVVNKVAGLPVHASVDNIQENLQAYLEKAVGCQLFGTHRLDVPTQGLIVYAKSTEFQSAFNKLLITREIQKIYRATVEGETNFVGTLTHFMEPSPRAPKKVAKEAHPGWQECVLEVLSATPLENLRTELQIQLHTGRTHQIRAQMGFHGHPIVGDHAYGAEKIYTEDRIELQACELRFLNPMTGEAHHFKI
ncbi:MAG: RluA family pseudouridine synthase [Bdellovibrio sp.]|nr:RluA family pseudouridine synthase [Bdellovibrio sp.]